MTSFRQHHQSQAKKSAYRFLFSRRPCVSQRQSVRELPGNEKSGTTILDKPPKQTPHQDVPNGLEGVKLPGIERHSLTAPLLRDKALQPCKDFIVELLSRKGRLHP